MKVSEGTKEEVIKIIDRVCKEEGKKHYKALRDASHGKKI